MAVKDKSDSTKEVSEGTSIEWNVENELQLLLVLCGTKPIGISKYFQMACIVEKLSSNLNKEITAKSVWDHLGTMYDLKKFDELEGIPFPNEEQDFVLSVNEFGDLMAVKSEYDTKKVLKKDEIKRERTSTETPPQTGKKAVKRTRASTTPNTPVPTVTPKRRRL